jgi:hypothetical protein
MVIRCHKGMPDNSYTYKLQRERRKMYRKNMVQREWKMEATINGKQGKGKTRYISKGHAGKLLV